MRAVFIGASTLTSMTAALLLKRGHEVVVIDHDKSAIDALREKLDCGFILADGSKPRVLREVDPGHCDFLFCFTGNDQSNIIAGLVGRSLGIGRVFVKINDSDFEHVCIELGLPDVIIPARTIGRHLGEIVEGQDPLEISAMVKGEARAFEAVIRKEDARPLNELDLPADTRVVCFYRKGEFRMPKDDEVLEPGDEIVLITHARQLPKLIKRFGTAVPGGKPPPENGAPQAS